MADELAVEAKVRDNLHSCFLTQRERLWRTISHFHLFDLKGKNVLEIGAFYSFTPFVLRKNGNAVTVIEGDDPATLPLKPMYASRGIDVIYADLSVIFGNLDITKRRLPLPDNHFDVIVCWETMEHFNFNPVGFVKEIHRVLKPGGIATLTVPNRAKLEHRIKMIIGRPMGETIESYYVFYAHSGPFFGWHWREYTLKEFVELFSKENFTVESAGCLTYFMNRPQMSFARAAYRFMARALSSIFPSLGTICALVVRK